MNDLITKILDNDQVGMLKVITKCPGLLYELSESNRTPLELAKATGSPYIYVTLLRHLQKNNSNENMYGLLTEYIGQISNDWLCSSWNHGIEFKIWHALKGNRFKLNDEEECQDLNSEMKKDLEWLSSEINGWATFEENNVVPLDKWEIQYNEWLQQ